MSGCYIICLSNHDALVCSVSSLYLGAALLVNSNQLFTMMCFVIRWICQYIRYLRFYLLKPCQLMFGFLFREWLIEISPSVHFLNNVPGDCSSFYNRIERFCFVYQSFQYVGRSPHRPVREFMRTLTRTTKGRRLLVYLTINLIATGKKLSPSGLHFTSFKL